MKAEDLLSAMSEIDERFTDESASAAPRTAGPFAGRENGRVIRAVSVIVVCLSAALAAGWLSAALFGLIPEDLSPPGGPAESETGKVENEPTSAPPVSDPVPADGSSYFRCGGSVAATLRGALWSEFYDDNAGGWLSADAYPTYAMHSGQEVPVLYYQKGEEPEFVNNTGLKFTGIVLFDAVGTQMQTDGGIASFLDSNPGEYWLCATLTEYGRIIDGRQEKTCWTEGVKITTAERTQTNKKEPQAFAVRYERVAPFSGDNVYKSVKYDCDRDGADDELYLEYFGSGRVTSTLYCRYASGGEAVCVGRFEFYAGIAFAEGRQGGPIVFDSSCMIPTDGLKDFLLVEPLASVGHSDGGDKGSIEIIPERTEGDAERYIYYSGKSYSGNKTVLYTAVPEKTTASAEELSAGQNFRAYVQYFTTESIPDGIRVVCDYYRIDGDAAKELYLLAAGAEKAEKVDGIIGTSPYITVTFFVLRDGAEGTEYWYCGMFMLQFRGQREALVLGGAARFSASWNAKTDPAVTDGIIRICTAQGIDLSKMTEQKKYVEMNGAYVSK